MKKFYIETWGCQMNVHDSEKMAGILRLDGCIETDTLPDADIVIFNTCSIREKAEQKFYSELGRIKSLKKTRPHLQIMVTGCIAQQEGATLLQRAPQVNCVIGPQNIHLLSRLKDSRDTVVATGENELITQSDLPMERKEKVRAWVNVMYGCDNFCSYCIVPITRGRERSRPSDNIVAEVRALAASGCREVTLLGQNVNSYRSALDFPGLLREIGKSTGIARIRFVTSHPKDLSDDLVRAVKDVGSVCEHIHLPLQSGSTRILKLMNRGYSYGQYLTKVQALRKLLPEMSITSDIIAGFPQEEDEDHRATLSALKEIEFDGIFAFKFSPRPGTRAATMDGQLDDALKSARLSEILTLQEGITERKNSALQGTFQEILVEGKGERGDERLTGRTRTNKIVHIPPGRGVQPGDVIRVQITHANKHSLQGSLSE